MVVSSDEFFNWRPLNLSMCPPLACNRQHFGFYHASENPATGNVNLEHIDDDEG